MGSQVDAMCMVSTPDITLRGETVLLLFHPQEICGPVMTTREAGSSPLVVMCEVCVHGSCPSSAHLSVWFAPKAPMPCYGYALRNDEGEEMNYECGDDMVSTLELRLFKTQAGRSPRGGLSLSAEKTTGMPQVGDSTELPVETLQMP